MVETKRPPTVSGRGGGAVPSGVASLLGELVCTSSIDHVTVRREGRKQSALAITDQGTNVNGDGSGEGLSLRGSLRSSVNSFTRVPQITLPRDAKGGNKTPPGIADRGQGTNVA